MDKELALLLKELRNIANAERFNRELFDDDSDFACWAQNRCRHVLRATEPNGYGMPGDAIWLPAPNGAPRFDLYRYVNAARIDGSDAPHIVVEKLQRAINAAALKRTD